MDGILLIEKPRGWTSHDVVAKVRNILKKETGRNIKVGHTGTLDPMATGLLILVIGGYTKRAQEFSKLDKTYQAELSLGAVSTTYDAEGEVSEVSDKRPSETEVLEVLRQFTGEIDQTPPQFSAVKVAGQKSYQAARAGKKLNLEPRAVTIYQLQLDGYLYPKLSFTARVSSGTYIRSLASDIGEQLGTGAFLSYLRRCRVAKYRVEDAVMLDNITISDIINNLKQIPPK